MLGGMEQPGPVLPYAKPDEREVALTRTARVGWTWLQIVAAGIGLLWLTALVWVTVLGIYHWVRE